jgi:hypothetical protein
MAGRASNAAKLTPRGFQMSRRSAASLRDKAEETEETVEQFLARGGKVLRVEDHPDPDGRVLFRGRHLSWNATPKAK